MKTVRKPQSVIDRERQELAQHQQRRQEEIEQRNLEIERAKQERDARALALLHNPRFEYRTVYIEDSKDGTLDKNLLQKTLMEYANEGWRLHTIFTNELGKNVDPAFIGSRNATVEETILIFERCIKLAGQ